MASSIPNLVGGAGQTRARVPPESVVRRTPSTQWREKMITLLRAAHNWQARTSASQNQDLRLAPDRHHSPADENLLATIQAFPILGTRVGTRV